MDGVSVSTLSAKLGISQSYLSQLLNGDKSWAVVSDAVLRCCAEYLELPVVICFLLAGRLRTEDFFKERGEFTQQMAAALKVVGESRFALEQGVDSRELQLLPQTVQHLLVQLFEAATGTELVPGRVGWDSIVAAGQKLQFEVKVVRQK